MNNHNYKQVFWSIFIGAVVAFLSTLFQSLANFFQTYGTELVAGGVASFWHAIKTIKIT